MSEDTGFDVRGNYLPQRKLVEIIEEHKAEITRLRRELKMTTDDLYFVIASEKRLREALEWYGNPDHWQATIMATGEYGSVPAADDRGSRARAALIGEGE